MNTLDRTVASLKPEALDTAESTPADESRIPVLTAAARERAGRRVPRLAIGLAAGAAAAAVIVPLSLPDDAAKPTATSKPMPTPLNAKAFLLAGAQTVERAGAPADGKYWFTSSRVCSDSSYKKIDFTECTTQNEWKAKDGFTRIDIGLDSKITFPSAADRAAWKAAGSPRLGERPSREELRGKSRAKWDVERDRMTLKELGDLPTTPAALRKVIIETFQGAPRGKAERDGFVWSIASQLLLQPITPGTRAGLYRMLAEIPGVKIKTMAKAPDGGRATVLSLAERGPWGRAFETFLTFRSDTYEFLGNKISSDGQVQIARLKAEWTNTMG